MASGLPQLQSLNISYCGNISDYCRDNITDLGIRALASGLLQLQSLDICICDKILLTTE